MRFKAWQWWAKLTPTNKLITGLAIALCVVWTAREAERRVVIKSLISQNGSKDVQIDSLNNRLVDCERVNAEKRIEEMRQSRDQAQEEKQKSDSLYRALAAAQREVKKALKNAKR